MKMQYKLKHYATLIHFIKYCTCGGTSAIFGYLFYYVSVNFGIWYGTANGISYLFGTLISFFLNRKITFQANDQMLYRLISFLGVAFIGFISSTFLLWLLIDRLAIDPRLAKIIVLPIEAILQFSLNYTITFKKRPAENIESEAEDITEPA